MKRFMPLTRRGHSLMELMTTMAIVAVLTLMAVASYAWVMPWVKEKLGITH